MYMYEVYIKLGVGYQIAEDHQPFSDKNSKWLEKYNNAAKWHEF